MNPYLFESDVRDNQERYNEYMRQARLLKLIREAQAARKAAPEANRPASLLARIFAALTTRRTARAMR
jgi:hypothetical protein